MGTFGPIALERIWQMLDSCAPGYTVRTTRHHHRVTYGGRTYATLPTGAHGSINPDVERGHVNKMARYLGIFECCERLLRP